MNSIFAPGAGSSGISIEDCCAVLLRGGKSRRMGRDKALLPWKESTFLETIAAQLGFLDEKYLSVAAEDAGSDQGGSFQTAKGSKKGAGPKPEELPGDWIRLPDLIPDRGPLGGIYTALYTCKAQWALVVSCDVPAVQQPFFKMLLDQGSDDLDILYPITPDGHMHMTCALYRKSIAPILRQQIEKGDNRLRVLAELCRAKAIRIEQPDLIQMISNINTGEEFDRFLIS